jgi:hypothetical protein
MDGIRFDDALRSLVSARTRRGVLGLSLASALASLLGLAGADAKK